LLFAPGEAPRWPLCDGLQADKAQQLNGTRSAVLSPDTGGRKREMKITRRAAPKHHWALKDECPT
jgi:hypothetical protein